jgi:hypothetical protein
MNSIVIDVGIDTVLEVNLADVDFSKTKEVVFTIKNTPSPKSEPIVEHRFTEAKLYEVVVTAEQSIQLVGSAQYDFQKISNDGIRTKLTDNGNIELRHSVGDKFD